MKDSGWIVQKLKHRDYVTVMTYPTVLTFVSIYMTAEKNAVKFVGLTPMWAGKFYFSFGQTFWKILI